MKKVEKKETPSSRREEKRTKKKKRPDHFQMHVGKNNPKEGRKALLPNPVRLRKKTATPDNVGGGEKKGPPKRKSSPLAKKLHSFYRQGGEEV